MDAREELASLKAAIRALPAVPSWYLKWLGDCPEARAAINDHKPVRCRPENYCWCECRACLKDHR